MSWLLGMLATAMERWDDATRHFEDSLRLSAQTGSKPTMPSPASSTRACWLDAAPTTKRAETSW